MKQRLLLSLLSIIALFSSAFAQVPAEGYKFSVRKQLPATSVKNQERTNTCWSFSAISMLESELIRTGKGEFDLSEMFIVYHNYIAKADRFVRMHGKSEFAGGGENNDVTDVMQKWGIAPESAFSGLKPGEAGHNHLEMDKILRGYVDEIVKNGNQLLSPVWLSGFESILQSYLGKLPEDFKFDGKKYTPETFSSNLGLNTNDYVMITSYTHHPFYSSFILELPDNWSWGKAYNVPLDELTSIVDNAINTGYTVAWASDVSDKGFNFKQGIALVPDMDEKKASVQDWEKVFLAPGKEKLITQELRQRDFDNYATTDDHGMHITGIAGDQQGNKYYCVKNSWGIENPYKGFIYVSQPYFKLRTTVIFLNKKAIPEGIKIKLGIL